MKNKIISSKEAARLVKTGDTIATTGFLGLSYPEEFSIELEKRFLDENEPKDLTLYFPSAQGDKDHKAVNRYAHEGFVKRVIGGHYNLAPKMIKFILEEKCEAYNLPQGVMVQLLRNIGSGRPGLLTHVGLNTFVDPRLEGGKLNERTKEDIVEVIEFKGKEYLYYQGLNIDVGIIRGTTADEQGNITIEKEAHHNESLLLAQATKNTGGIVIAQVERVAEYGTLNPRNVVVPGINVDYIIVAKPENHMQTNTVQYDPSCCGEIRRSKDSIEPMSFSERKIIARRAAMELEPGDIINLGIGMPEGVAQVAGEEGLDSEITATVESGGIGGITLSGIDFGGVINPDAMLPHYAQFDFYDGGGLDVAFLGLAQVDALGNLNASKFNGRIAGCGGFINITQNAKKVVFVGTFTASGLKIEVKDDKLTILQEGKVKKFINEIEQVTFSAKYSKTKGQKVVFVTERAVFELREDGIELVEIAPGIDVEKDILSQMEFDVKISDNLKTMDARIFKEEKMGIYKEFMEK